MIEKQIEIDKAFELLAMDPLPANAEARLEALYQAAPAKDKRKIETMFEALAVAQMAEGL